MKHFSLLLLLFASMASAQEKVSISFSNEVKGGGFKFDRYQFVNRFTSDAFYITGLYRNLSAAEMSKIIEAVRNHVSAKNEVKIAIMLPDGKKATLDFRVEQKSRKETILTMITNFNPKTGEFGKSSMSDFARYYFIIGNKAVYRKDLFSTDREKKLLDGKDRTGLIELYFHDDLTENDEKIKLLIDEILTDAAASKTDRFKALLQLSQYYLSNGKTAEAENSIDKLTTLFNENGGMEIPSDLGIYTKIIRCEADIMAILP